MAQGRPIEEKEITEVLAHYQPADIKLGSRLGQFYPQFAESEKLLVSMHEDDWIDRKLLDKIMRSRFGFKQMLPDRALPGVLKAVAEAKNPNVELSMWSTAGGAKVIGDTVVPIMKKDIPGMDAREIHELINENLVKDMVSFKDGVDVMKQLVQRAKLRGDTDDEDAKKFMDASSYVMKVLQELGVPVG